MTLEEKLMGRWRKMRNEGGVDMAQSMNRAMHGIGTGGGGEGGSGGGGRRECDGCHLPLDPCLPANLPVVKRRPEMRKKKKRDEDEN